jgi:hypothetical protein
MKDEVLCCRYLKLENGRKSAGRAGISQLRYLPLSALSFLFLSDKTSPSQPHGTKIFPKP